MWTLAFFDQKLGFQKEENPIVVATITFDFAVRGVKRAVLGPDQKAVDIRNQASATLISRALGNGLERGGSLSLPCSQRPATHSSVPAPPTLLPTPTYHPLLLLIPHP